jgi:hypothetical protein
MNNGQLRLPVGSWLTRPVYSCRCYCRLVDRNAEPNENGETSSCSQTCFTTSLVPLAVRRSCEGALARGPSLNSISNSRINSSSIPSLLQREQHSFFSLFNSSTDTDTHSSQSISFNANLQPIIVLSVDSLNPNSEFYYGFYIVLCHSEPHELAS